MRGSVRFAMFALPCAEHFNKEDKDKLEGYITGLKEPYIAFLELRFPVATQDMREFWVANYPSNTYMWSDEVVRAYWHQHKGKGDDCEVRLGTVCNVSRDNKLVEVLSNDKTTNILNRYNHSISIGDSVYFHHNNLIEKEKE